MGAVHAQHDSKNQAMNDLSKVMQQMSSRAGKRNQESCFPIPQPTFLPFKHPFHSVSFQEFVFQMMGGKKQTNPTTTKNACPRYSVTKTACEENNKQLVCAVFPFTLTCLIMEGQEKPRDISKFLYRTFPPRS